MAYRYEGRNSTSTSDDPPNSRLFIVSSKSLTEDDFRDAFEKFGQIEELWLVKDKQTKENKGVAYIKFSKTSEAAVALEEMNMKCIGSSPRPLKVMIAASRDKGTPKDPVSEEERSQRLFVVVPKIMTDSELPDYFKRFGDIEYCHIVRDRNTKESKGVAYVKYYKFSHAAKAFEECDPKYRAVFAEPRKPNVKSEERSYSHSHDHSRASRDSYDSNLNRFGSLIPPVDVPSGGDGYNTLTVTTGSNVNEDQLWKLFDIVPGMDYLQLKYDNRTGRGLATVVYTEHRWAAHAKEKLHGFEFPPGNRLIVRPDLDSSAFSMPSMHPGGEKRKADLLQLAETIAQASSLIQAAGISPELLLQGKFNKEETRCSIKLPDPMPLADIDSDVAARCFIVCSPHPPSQAALRDVFSRFGSLIDVYMLSGKNCGYAKYASRASADAAIKTLHGAEVNSIRLRVLEAEEPRQGRKRQKIDDAYKSMSKIVRFSNPWTNLSRRQISSTLPNSQGIIGAHSFTPWPSDFVELQNL